MFRAGSMIAAVVLMATWASNAPAAIAPGDAAPPQQLEPKTFFSLDDLLNGKRMSRAECDAIPIAVWVTADGMSECLRYYMSHMGDPDEAVVILNGDLVITEPGQAPSAPGYEKASVEGELNYAARRARFFGKTFIELARPGTLGSSGSELKVRHTVHEARLVNAALDAIALKEGIRKFDLVGQSGGSILIGALLAMRGDIGCASIGSGRLALAPYTNAPKTLATENWRALLDDQAYVVSIRKSTGLRAFILSDPDDVHSPIAGQSLFALRATAAGLPVTQLMTVAVPDKGAHHNVVGQAIRAMKECLAGTSDVAIAEIIRQFALENARKWAALTVPPSPSGAPPVSPALRQAPAPASRPSAMSSTPAGGVSTPLSAATNPPASGVGSATN
ncbi:MAG: hypothetical protein JO273_24165 [Methylobacteriaceae bacterium]|nr:hypothetical protein [Methylobacteriaceae bacterium]